MNVVLCDDESLFLTSIEQKVRAWAEKNGRTGSVMIHAYASSEDLLDAWQHGLQIDALFLDIQIPGEMSGLALAKEIHQVNEYIPIVFITSYGEYAEEGYTVNALRYLRKPISEQAIAECMDIFWRRWKLQHSDSLVMDLPTQLLRLPVKTILYIEVQGHYCMIRTSDNEEGYRFRHPLDAIRKKLTSQLFVQCHRSFLVNLMYVRHISNSYVTMADGTVIPLGKNYQQQLVQQFRNLYLKGGAD